MPAACGAPSVAIQMRPLLSKAQLSGQESQPFSVARAMVACAASMPGSPATQEDLPGALGRGVVALAVAGRDHLDDMAVGVVRHADWRVTSCSVRRVLLVRMT